ncbi:MAG: DoxX family protein [Actinomycetota bacterium]|nr:DoxX family protein [Actinomycetota bacterium]
MKLGLTFLRTVVGALFFGHGTQKLFGWFGGHGPEATGQFFENLGLKPGIKHARAAGAAEAGGGALLALGLFTPAAAAALIGVMSTAIRTVHLKNGPWASDGGYEYPLALLVTMVALADLGPGEISLDHALGTEIKGPLVALGALAAGVGGAAVMTRSSESEPAGAAPVPADPAATSASGPSPAAA